MSATEHNRYCPVPLVLQGWQSGTARARASDPKRTSLQLPDVPL